MGEEYGEFYTLVKDLKGLFLIISTLIIIKIISGIIFQKFSGVLRHFNMFYDITIAPCYEALLRYAGT